MIRSLAFLLVFMLCSCKSDKRYHDRVKDSEPEKALNYSEEITALREAKDHIFKGGKESPLTSGQRAGFKGLDYFAVDTAYVVEARLEPEAVPQVAVLPTTTDAEQAQLLYGVLYFTLKGREFRLNVYRDPGLDNEPGYEDYLFLPFTDLTNAETTYGGGRYMDLSVQSGNRLTLDFNKAYNPYCAYNKKYSCPLVPAVNHLEIAIEAGERAFMQGQ